MESEMKDSKQEQFGEISDNDIEKLIEGRSALNTRCGTKTWTGLLKSYIKLHKLGDTIEDVKTDDLPEVLEHFFAELKKPNKDKSKPASPYKNSSMRVIRGGINRYMKEKRGVDIMSDSRFIRCKHLFQGVLKENKSKGYGTIEHKESITLEDLECLNAYFSKYMQPNPQILQRFVQFNLMYFLCRRGRENLTGMSKETFAIACDSDGTLYVYQKVNEHDKNHNENDTEKSNDGYIYQKKGSTLCPVKTYELYMQRLDPDFPYLWQQPKSSVTWNDAFWFEGVPLSKNKIGNLMTTLSKEAKLAKMYTNHCIRNTSITILVSGHKKVESITNYAHRTSETKKREMSEDLATALVDSIPQKKIKTSPQKRMKEPPSATVSRPPDQKEQNFETIDQLQMRDLLQMTPDEEEQVLNEIFNIPFESSNVNQVVKIVSNVSENRPNYASVAPRMMFQNSNVTINFNITGPNI